MSKNQFLDKIIEKDNSDEINEEIKNILTNFLDKYSTKENNNDYLIYKILVKQ